LQRNKEEMDVRISLNTVNQSSSTYSESGKRQILSIGAYVSLENVWGGCSGFREVWDETVVESFILQETQFYVPP
jgi:hypothetical protein